ncbi:transmembrane protein 245-like isoform X2 [Amphiura filiformis]|uniref:transmembrane protein 245-like isoform X2 n=1 Tax=Amphiura filiformis TaxID=82378 RepID=UPI003B21B9C8
MASTQSATDLRSPLDSIMNIFPQGHDKALKQAFYNAATLLFVFLSCGAAVVMYFVLEIFLRPLLWAVLCGTALYPFKYTLSSILDSWLQGLQDSGTPLVVGTVAIPLTLLNFASEVLGQLVSKWYKILIAVIVGLPLAYLGYQFLDSIWYGLCSVFYMLYNALDYFSTLWVWTIVIAFLLLVIFWWNSASKSVLSALAVPIWITLLLHLANLTGPYRVPLFILVITLVVMGYNTHAKGKGDSTDGLDDDSEIFDSSSETTSRETSPSPEEESVGSLQGVEGEDDPDIDRPAHLIIPGKHRHRKRRKEQKEEPVQTANFFYALFFACILVKMWMHMWLLQLLPIPIAIWLFKRFAVSVGLWDMLKRKFDNWKATATEWIGDRSDALMPPYIRGLVSLFLNGDRKVISYLRYSMDKVITIIIILTVFTSALVVTFFLAFQIQQESMHLIEITGNLVNDTVSAHPELQQWVTETADIQDTMDSVLGNAYVYGREWIGSKARSLVGGDKANQDNIEKQVLEIWDQLYVQWVAKNATKSEDQAIEPGGFLKGDMSWGGLMDSVGSSNVDLSGIMEIVQDNIDTVKSVLESVWMVVKGNANLLFTICTTALSVVFEGSTALLNFVLSFVVFMTTLFYLLSFSGDQYLPMEWLSNFTPGGGKGSEPNKYSTAVEDSIRGVFVASGKMSAFYGIYTWLTHTVFGIQLIYMPAVLAAILGAIPFLGTYWATIPGVIDLLVQGENGMALGLFIAHILPTMMVDTAIYAEIKGGGHPYLTALSIAGGILYFGLEGALIGPMLLACLLVAITLFSKLMQSAPNMPDTPVNPKRIRSDTQ